MLTAISETDAQRYRASRKDMLRLMHHIHITDMVVYANLTGFKHEYTDLYSRRNPDEASLATSISDCRNRYVDYLRNMSDHEWNSPVSFHRINLTSSP